MLSLVDNSRTLVGAGEEPRALEQLLPLLKTLDRRYYRESLVQIGRLKDLARRERQGVVSPVDAQIERNRVRQAILELLDEIEDGIARDLLPLPMQPVALTPPASSSLEKIIGANNLKSIAWLRKGLACARSVCRIVTPKGLGTGFLIAGGRLVTNHHVIPDASAAFASVAELGFEEDDNGNILEPSRYRLKASSLQASQDLDFCIVELDGSSHSTPLESWGWLDLELDQVPQTGEHVTIIQHPGGGPKQIGITANQVVNQFGHRLQYTTDTLPGSSGAPVFNDDWKVVAVHHAGGNIVKNAAGEIHYANEGILVGSILKAAGSASSFLTGGQA